MAILQTSGSFASALILITADIFVTISTKIAHGLVGIVDGVFGSGVGTARKKVPFHEPRYLTAPVYKKMSEGSIGTDIGEVDEAATLAASKFPIKPDDLVDLARRVFREEFGTAEGSDPTAILSDDFQFVAPIIGPIGREEFLRAFGSFKLREAIPNFMSNVIFRVDPLEPNRVWHIDRLSGTHDGTLCFAGKKFPATGISIRYPPTASSVLFNEDGKCYTLTVGYCMDKRIGNTEGLAGVFGVLKAVGSALPFPEGQRLYNPSLRWEGFERIGKAFEALGYDPATGGKRITAAPTPTEQK